MTFSLLEQPAEEAHRAFFGQAPCNGVALDDLDPLPHAHEHDEEENEEARWQSSRRLCKQIHVKLLETGVMYGPFSPVSGTFDYLPSATVVLMLHSKQPVVGRIEVVMRSHQRLVFQLVPNLVNELAERENRRRV